MIVVSTILNFEFFLLNLLLNDKKKIWLVKDFEGSYLTTLIRRVFVPNGVSSL